MTIVQTILFIAGLFAWVCVSGIILITSIQSFISHEQNAAMRITEPFSHGYLLFCHY